MLLSAIDRGATALIADMTRTLSCDHSGVDAIARAHQRAVISGTDQLVSVYFSREAALAARAPAVAHAPVPASRAICLAR